MTFSSEGAPSAQLSADAEARVSEIRAVLRPPAAGQSATERDGRARLLSIVQQDGGCAAEGHTGSASRLSIVSTGRLIVTVARDDFAIGSGEALLIPPGRVFKERPGGSAPLQQIVITWTGGEATVLARLSDCAGRLREVAHWLLVERNAAFAGAAGYRDDLIRVLLNECRRLELDGAGVLEKSVRAFVLEHIGEVITLDALARYIGMGRFHLCRKYRQATGISPMHAVRVIRMEQARHLIQHTAFPLRTVAQRVGVRSEQHLSRLLKEHFGAGVKDLRRGSVPADSDLNQPPPVP